MKKSNKWILKSFLIIVKKLIEEKHIEKYIYIYTYAYRCVMANYSLDIIRKSTNIHHIMSPSTAKQESVNDNKSQRKYNNTANKL